MVVFANPCVITSVKRLNNNDGVVYSTKRFSVTARTVINDTDVDIKIFSPQTFCVLSVHLHNKK